MYLSIRHSVGLIVLQVLVHLLMPEILERSIAVLACFQQQAKSYMIEVTADSCLCSLRCFADKIQLRVTESSVAAILLLQRLSSVVFRLPQDTFNRILGNILMYMYMVIYKLIARIHSNWSYEIRARSVPWHLRTPEGSRWQLHSRFLENKLNNLKRRYVNFSPPTFLLGFCICHTMVSLGNNKYNFFR